MTSTRLPRKILEVIDRKPVINHVVDNVSSSIYVDKVIVASPHKIPLKLNVDTFIGDEDNVLKRFYDCAKKYKAGIIVRVTADCPLVDPAWIDTCIHLREWGKYEYVSNRPYCPDGFDVEVFTFDALKKAYKNATSAYDKEHVTPYMINNLKCGIIEHSCFKYPDVKLSIDTKEDLERVRLFYYEFRKQNDSSYWRNRFIWQ